MKDFKDYMKDYLLEEEKVDRKIEWKKYIQKLWTARKTLFKVAIIASIVGVVIALTTPKQYTVHTTLAPESSKPTNSSISSLTSTLGLGNLTIGNDVDALKVTLYPQIVASTPFIIDLLDTPLKNIGKEKIDTTFIGYLTEHTKKSLVNHILSLPFKAIDQIKSLFPNTQLEDNTNEINPFKLTKKQTNIVKGIRKKIVANVDKKNGVTTVAVTMQDPVVAAVMTDTVVAKLKQHITKYRTSKAEADYKYWEQIYNERKNEYHEKQQAYAEYVDANKNIVLQSVRIEQVRLQNEMNLAYQVYSNVATQLQMARAKVQEAKPVFAIVEPATIPLKPSGTNRKAIALIIVLLAISIAIAWILIGKDLYQKTKNYIQTNL